MGSQADNSRGLGRFRLPDAARRVAAGWPWEIRTNPAVGPTGSKAAKAAVLLAAVFAVVLAAAVAAAPALAQTSGNAPDYVLEDDGTVVIDGDGATDCRSFALALEQGYFESGGTPSAQAQSVLEQCEEAGLLSTGGTGSSASASASASVPANASPSPGASAVGGESGELPETGGPALPALLVVSSVVVAASGLLLRKVGG